MSIFTSIESIFTKGEADFKLVIGDVEKYFVAHPSLEADLKLLFGPAITILIDAGKAIESSTLAAVDKGATLGSVVNTVIDGIGNAVPAAVKSIVSQADNSANAYQIASTAASYIVGQIAAQVTPTAAMQPVTATTALPASTPPAAG
jgi:hypothetical protein